MNLPTFLNAPAIVGGDDRHLPSPTKDPAQKFRTDVESGGTGSIASSSASQDIEAKKDQVEDDRDDDNTVLGSARTPWYWTSIIMLADVLGTGILSLPYAAAVLGWACSLVCITIFALLANYSSVLLSKVQQMHPHFTSFAIAATELGGPRFGKFTQICILLNWGSLAVYFLVAAADSIGNITTYGLLDCQINRTIIAALLLLIPCQMRDFHSMSKVLAAPSFLAIIGAVAIILITLLVQDAQEFGSNTTVGPAPGTNGFDFINAMAAIVFAYKGQSIFFELMAEMKSSNKFPSATMMAYIIMFLAYSTTAIVAYGIKGSSVPGFLPNILDGGSANAKAVSVLTCFHIMVAYVVCVQPLHVWLHCTFFPKTVYKSTWNGSRDWLITTVSFTLIGWTIANLIPFFADIQSLIGNLFGAPIMFGWPPLFYFLAKRQETESKSIHEALRQMGWWNGLICGFMLLVLVPLFVIFGTIGSMISLIDDAQNAGQPFGC